MYILKLPTKIIVFNISQWLNLKQEWNKYYLFAVYTYQNNER